MKHSKIYRKKIIEGVSIPGIINNGGDYFFIDLEVYEDGRVNCWNFEDFEHFKKDVHRGWVATSIPDRKEISVHGLGSWKIGNGQWEYNKETFIEYVFSIIQMLNPNLENLYKHSVKKINGVTIGESGNGKLYKEIKQSPHDLFPEKVIGKSNNLFLKAKPGNYYLARLDIYNQNSIVINRIPEPLEITIGQLEEMISKEEFSTAIPLKSRVEIYGFGHFEILKQRYCNEISEKLLEIKDTISVLNGQPSLVEICRNKYEAYCKDPSPELKAQLKIAYENVPKHERPYIGDMDTKDIPVRMIIYGEREIERWSHFQLAKKLGEKLPWIKIPKTRDKK